MKQPCKECPFRKTSAPGYLGANTGKPHVFLNCMTLHPIPCHMQVEEDEWDDVHIVAGKSWENTCIGSLQFLKNTASLPYQRAYAALRDEAGRNTDVFETRHEFIEHHTMKEVKS
jgi:hypothetical protein